MEGKADRIEERFSLLAKLDGGPNLLANFDGAQAMTERQRRAARLSADGRIARAFDLDLEPDRVRDAYGRHLFGQSLILARRLLQAGVPIVQVNLAAVNVQWDTLTDNFETLQRTLLPPFDLALSSLLDDMDASGLLQETLVVVAGEFARTPSIGGNVGTPFYSPTGRDHWTDCFSAVFAGAGVQGGRVIGRSDRIAAYPATPPYTPADLGATVYAALGVEPRTVVRDVEGRPTLLNEGRVMHALYA